MAAIKIAIIVIVVICGVLHETKAQSRNCTAKTRIDLVFVVDQSGSICDVDPTYDRVQRICNNWRLVRTFLTNIVQAFTIGEDDVKIGLVTFGNQGKLEFALSSDRNKILSDIGNLQYAGQNTNTSGGIKVARAQVFGQTGDRSSVQNVMMILTDGQSTRDASQTVPQANAAKRENVTVYAIGIAAAKEQELKDMSSPPQAKDANYFINPNFDALSKVVLDKFLQQTCVTSAPTTSTSTTTTPTVPTTRPIRTTRPGEPCVSLLDLTFLVDMSGSICNDNPDHDFPSPPCDNWRKMRQFMINVVSHLEIGPTLTRVAVVTFANDAVLKWNLKKYSDEATLVTALNSLEYQGGNTNTAGALKLVREQLYTGDEATTGDRRHIQDVVIVLTDGKSTVNPNNTIPEAEFTKNRDIMIFAIGITESVEESELKGMSSLPQEKDFNYFMTPNFEMLDTALEALLVGVCTNTLPPPTACSTEADVMLILDSSGSIRQSNFERIKQWLVSLILTLDIDSGKIRLGLITFSDNARMRFLLNEYKTREENQAAIRELDYTRGTTNTGAALAMALNMFSSGIHGNRPGVADIIILMTDGGSNDKKKTVEEAVKVKNRGIHLLTIGMGDWIDKYELYSLASHPYQDNVIEVPNYDNLNRISNRLKNIICSNNDACSSNPCQNQGRCRIVAEMYVCDCVSPYGGVNCEYRCRQPADISLALDSSGSIGRDNFLLMLDFAKRFMMEMPMETANMAFETYADNPQIYFHLKDNKGRMQMLNAMTIPYYSGGTTDTAGALRNMRDSMFTTQNGDQPNRPNIGIVVTDGRSNNMPDTWRQAMDNRNAGIEMIAVGVGGNTRQEELEGIASWPTSQNVLKVDQFQNLRNMVSSLRDLVCNAADECSSNPCRNGGRCVDVRGGFYCECQTGYSGVFCERGCNAMLDLAVVMDKSGSIQHQRFPLVKNFINGVLSNLTMWQDRVRVAAVSFHNDAQLHFNLNSYSGSSRKLQDIMMGVQKIAFGGGRTNIASALDIVRTQVFTQSAGDRSQAPNIVLVFTDGSSNIRSNETIPSAIETRINGARIITVAVGRDLNMMEIYGISSLPTSDNVFYIQSYYDLPALLSKVIAGTCNDVNECSSNPCQNGGQCQNEYKMYRCVCTSDYTGERCERSCRRQYDVAFVLDFSGSVDSVYEQILTFTRTAFYGLDFKQDRERVALVTYDTNAKVQFLLNKYSSQRDVINALSFRRNGGRTNTQEALQLVRDQVFQSGNGDRSGVKNIVVLLTDGGSNVRPQNTIPMANDLKSRGSDIYVVQVGDHVDLNEVQGIASSSSSRYIIKVTNKESAVTQATSWLDSVCQR